MVLESSTSVSLKDYLKRYEATNEEEKKKKKRKKKAVPVATGVVVVDEDPSWQKPVELEKEDDVSEDEDKPLIDEDIEVKRMKRLEQIKAKQSFGTLSEDGSGWVSISNSSNDLKSGAKGLDQSYPSKRGIRNDTPSLEIGQKSLLEGGADLSPPRQQKSYHNVDISPPRKQRARYDTPSPDHGTKPLESASKMLDPPTLHSRQHSLSPEVRPSKCPALDDDLSPPRRHETLNGPDISPPRRIRHNSSFRDNSTIPEADLSPPRRRRKVNLNHGLDDAPSRRLRHCSPEFDDSHLHLASDLSPPRKRKNSAPVTMQPRTGLVSGKDVKEENIRAKKEELQRLREMDSSMIGQNAKPVYRDKITGDRLSEEQIKKLQKKEEKPKEIKLEWGKGLAQKREAEESLRELQLEKEKPFARTRDDPELDKTLKERVRWGDPMAHLVKKKHLEPVLPDLGDDDRMKKSGFIVPQEIPSHSWIRRNLDAAPNRYGIKPGRHWDGVDRSNGFEKESFKRMNEKRATQTEAYLWSVSDM